MSPVPPEHRGRHEPKPGRASKPDVMVLAWGILAGAFVLLSVLELGLLPWPTDGRLRSTELFSAPQKTEPTPWPTPQPLPATPGRVHTSAGQVRRLLAPPKPGKHPLVRIAYFADSISEGDIICATLRQKLQERFGGQGLGWLGMAPLDAWARDDIRQSFSPDWDRHSIFTKFWTGQAFGPGGLAWHLPQGSGTVRFKALRGLGAGGLMAPATLWYGPLGSEGAELDWTVNGHKDSQKIMGQASLNAFSLSAAPSRSLDLSLRAQPQQAFYGVSFDEGSGLDNFSMRGSQGGPLRRMDAEMLQSYQALRGVKLAIVHFGINALDNHADPQYKWYRRDLANGLRQLQLGLPGAAMVLVTTIDRATHTEGGWASDRYLPGLLAAQEAAASDVGIPCINAFDLMGGPGSIKAWAESKPSLAEHDYTHLSPLGGKRFGALLWERLEHLGQGGGKP